MNNEEHNTISFDKIDKSLIYFHEGTGQDFTIIRQKDEKDEEYYKLLDLKNSQASVEQDKIKDLPNFKKYNKFEFLKELKGILGLNEAIPIKKVIRVTRIQLNIVTINMIKIKII